MLRVAMLTRDSSLVLALKHVKFRVGAANSKSDALIYVFVG
jgi:hypothetical protein